MTAKTHLYGSLATMWKKKTCRRTSRTWAPILSLAIKTSSPERSIGKSPIRWCSWMLKNYRWSGPFSLEPNIILQFTGITRPSSILVRNIPYFLNKINSWSMPKKLVRLLLASVLKKDNWARRTSCMLVDSSPIYQGVSSTSISVW